MSSTSSDDDAALRRFFEERLVPAARRLRERHGDLFPTGPDPDRESYWTARPRPSMSRDDFTPDIPADPDALEAALARFWTAHDRAELAELAPDLAALARGLQEREVQDEEVSPFIYVMF